MFSVNTCIIYKYYAIYRKVISNALKLDWSLLEEIDKPDLMEKVRKVFSGYNRLLGQVRYLYGERTEMKNKISDLEKQVAELRRASKRQAAPFGRSEEKKKKQDGSLFHQRSMGLV